MASVWGRADCPSCPQGQSPPHLRRSLLPLGLDHRNHGWARSRDDRPRYWSVLLRAPDAVPTWDRVLGSSRRAGLATLVSVGSSPHHGRRSREPRPHRRRPVWEYIAVGPVSALARSGWRSRWPTHGGGGRRDPSRWQVEHLTSLLAAYTVGWSFILALYVPVLPERARLAVPVLGLVAILWARRRFRPGGMGANRAAEALTGAA